MNTLVFDGSGIQSKKVGSVQCVKKKPHFLISQTNVLLNLILRLEWSIIDTFETVQ